jgi:hypothetical protein
MGRAALSWQETDRIIDQEVRRFRGTLPGYDTDDLRQECRMAVALRIEPERVGARTYARVVARDRLTNLLKSATTFGRCPHDAWGRPMPTLAGLDDVLTAPAPENVEAQVADREAVAQLRARLDPRDWRQLVEAAIDGVRFTRAEDRLGLAEIQARASGILRRFGYRVRGESEARRMQQEIPEPVPTDIPECHPAGASPVGYAASEPECHNCRDKFTCLPRSIDKGLVQLRLRDDLEVAAVVEGRMAFMAAVARMKRRVARLRAGEEIQPDELPTWEGLLPEEEVDDEEAAEEAVEEAAEETGNETVDDDGAQSAPSASEPQASEATAHAADDSVGSAPSSPEREEDDVAKKTKSKKSPKAAKPKVVAKPKPAKPAKPKPAPSAVEKPAFTISKAGAVSVDGKKIGRVEEVPRKGWGWWAADGAESPSWLGSQRAAVAGLLRHAAAPAPKAKPAEEAAPKPKTWPSMSNGKALPAPKKLIEEEMVESLAEAQSKLGANLELGYGMSIARRKRDGDVVVTITANGWLYEVEEKLAQAAGFEKREQLFGSLSSVAMWAERRMVSGNDFFSLAKHNCTEVRDAEGRIIDRKGGVALRR